jgi:hypothetical protein
MELSPYNAELGKGKPETISVKDLIIISITIAEIRGDLESRID